MDPRANNSLSYAEALTWLLNQITDFKKTLATIIQDPNSLDKQNKYEKIFLDNEPNKSMTRALWNTTIELENFLKEMENSNGISKLYQVSKIAKDTKEIINKFYYLYDCEIIKMSSPPNLKKLNNILSNTNSAYVLYEDVDVIKRFHLFYVKKEQGICIQLTSQPLLLSESNSFLFEPDDPSSLDELMQMNQPYHLNSGLIKDIYKLTEHRHQFIDEKFGEMKPVLIAANNFLWAIYDRNNHSYNPEVIGPIVTELLKGVPVAPITTLLKTFVSRLPESFSVENYFNVKNKSVISLNGDLERGLRYLPKMIKSCDESKEIRLKKKIKSSRIAKPIMSQQEAMKELLAVIAEAKKILDQSIQDKASLNKNSQEYAQVFVNKNPAESMKRALWNAVIQIEAFVKNMDAPSMIRLAKGGMLYRDIINVVYELHDIYACDLVKLHSLSKLSKLHKIPGRANCAYVCVDGNQNDEYQIFYVMKKEGVCKNLGVIKKNALPVLYINEYVNEYVNAFNSADNITRLTGHKHLFATENFEEMELVLLLAKSVFQQIYDEEARQYRYELLLPIIKQATDGIPLNAVLDIIKKFTKDKIKNISIEKYLNPSNQTWLSLNSDVGKGYQAIDRMINYCRKKSATVKTSANPSALFVSNPLADLIKLLSTVLDEYKGFWHMQGKAAFGKHKTPDSIKEYIKMLNTPSFKDKRGQFDDLKVYANAKLLEYKNSNSDDRSEYLVKLHEAIQAERMDLLIALKKSIDEQVKLVLK